MVSALQQCKSIVYIYIYIYLPSLLSLPPLSHPTPVGQHRAPGWSPCVTYSFPLVTYFTHDSIYICQCFFLNSSHSFFSLLSFSCLRLERLLSLVTYLKPFYSFNICLSFALPEAIGPSSYLPKCLQWCHTWVPPWAASAAFNCSTCADDMPGHDVFFFLYAPWCPVLYTE